MKLGQNQDIRHGSNDSKNINISFGWLAILIVGYVFLQLLSNLTVHKTISLYFNFSIPFGSLLFAVTFTWIDLINEKLGSSKARVLVIIGIVSNIIMIVWFELYIAAPGTNDWNSTPWKQKAIEYILGGVPRIYGASLITTLVVENVDITVYQLVRKYFPRVPLWLRSAISNSVSVPLDAILFSVLAFGGVLSTDLIKNIIVTSCMYKLAVSYVTTPIIYLSRK